MVLGKDRILMMAPRYEKNTALAYIRQKRIFAVRISGKYTVPKSALVEFLIGDFAFEIVHKSTWHMNIIPTFKKTSLTTQTAKIFKFFIKNTENPYVARVFGFLFNE